MRVLRMGVITVLTLPLGILLLAPACDSTSQDSAAQSSPQTPTPQSSPGPAASSPWTS